MKNMNTFNINEIKPLLVTGFSDGESSFSVSISWNALYKTDYVFIPAFSIELKDKDIDLLYKIQSFFKGVGKIHKIKSKDHVVYTVSSINELEEVIISHFIKYPLLTVKRITFLLFKEIVHLMYKKSHLTLEGTRSIINIIASMNKARTDKFLINFPNIDIIPVALLKVDLLNISHISIDWFVGFTDAEGCFFINVRPNRKKTDYWALAGFSLVQHSRDLLLFKLLKEFLGGGFIVKENNKNVVRFLFKKAVGKQLGNILSSLGYTNNSEYIELQKRILEIKSRTKNIEELNSIINEMENSDSFVGIRKDLKEFKEEFLKELNNEKRIKDI